MSEKSGWVGGPKFTKVRQWGSGASNSARTAHKRGRTHFACGIDRASVGEIAHHLHASWAAKRSKLG